MSNAIFCYECSTATEESDEAGAECPNCGADNTVAATISDCPAWPGDCGSELHDYGRARTSKRCHVEEHAG